MGSAFLTRRAASTLAVVRRGQLLPVAPLTVLLAPLPGPNLIGYWFAYRAVHHGLILHGRHCKALRGRIETRLCPDPRLDPGRMDEPGRLAALGCDAAAVDAFLRHHRVEPATDGAGRKRREAFHRPAAVCLAGGAGVPSRGRRRASGRWTSRRCGCGMRLLSYNIHKGVGGRDRRYRIERIVEVVAAEAPRPGLPPGSRSARPADPARRPAGSARRGRRRGRGALSAQRPPAREWGGVRQPAPVALAVTADAPGLAAAEAAEAARGAARRRRYPRRAATPGPLAPRPGRARATLADRALAQPRVVPRVGRVADADRGRLQRLA